jgi:hypothetical protein
VQAASLQLASFNIEIKWPLRAAEWLCYVDEHYWFRIAVVCGLLSGEKEGRNFFARLRLEGCIKSPLASFEIHPENMNSVLHLRRIDTLFQQSGATYCMILLVFVACTS